MNKKGLLFLVISVLIESFCFSQSKPIRNLQLDFIRKDITENKSMEIQGNIFYNFNPYVFVFNISKPENQTHYLNSDGCFFINSKLNHPYPQDSLALNQTCIDLLTWFKKDFGLSDSGFKINSFHIEDNQLISVWGPANSNYTKIDKVLAFYDKAGNIQKIETFVGEELINKIELSKFIEKSGFYFPTKIETSSYQNNKVINQSFWEFSNIVFNQLETGKEFFGSNIKISNSKKVKTIKNDKTIAENPIPQIYRVSETSIMVNLAYNGYKKFITQQDNSNCPFEPSCSKYMLQAVSQNGVFGFFQGLERLRRCTASEHKTNNYPTNEKGKHVDPYKK